MVKKNTYIDGIKKIIKEDSGKYLIGWMGWYNHIKHNPCNLHFCSAITKENLDKLRGFDELYSVGNWYDDDEFLERAKLICDVKLIEETMNPYVIHLFHKSSNIGSNDAGVGTGQHQIDNNPLIQKNKKLLQILKDKIKNGYNNPDWLEYHKDKVFDIFGKVYYKKSDKLFNIDYFNKLNII